MPERLFVQICSVLVLNGLCRPDGVTDPVLEALPGNDPNFFGGQQREINGNIHDVLVLIPVHHDDIVFQGVGVYIRAELQRDVGGIPQDVFLIAFGSMPDQFQGRNAPHDFHGE